MAADACCISVRERKFLSKFCSVCFELEFVKAPEMYQTAINTIVKGVMKAMAPWTGAPGQTPESPAPLKMPDGGLLRLTPSGSGPGSVTESPSFQGSSSDRVLSEFTDAGRFMGEAAPVP
tara:strand:- start:120 stop:479 length:360 start_codon:yes stop_codon:yes gene_type:complete